MTSGVEPISRQRAYRMLVAVAVMISVSWSAHGEPACAADVHVQQRAVAEIMPGIYIRTEAGNLIIDAGEQECDPVCPPGSACVSVCSEAACPPTADPLSRCLRCGWDCAW